MRNFISFSGNLVRKNELQSSAKGVFYLNFTVARNYSKYNENKKEWEEVGTKFVNCTVFGKDAECFDKSDIPTGTFLIINGFLQGNPARTYTNKEGIEVEVPFDESVLVDSLGVSLSRNQIVSLNKKDNKKKEEVVEDDGFLDEGDMEEDYDTFFDELDID